MMSATQSFFAAQAVHFTDGRIAAMARPYLTPLPIEIEGDYYVLRRHRDVVAAFTAKREGVSAIGIDGLRVAVLDERGAAPGKVAATVEWFYIDGAGTRQARTRGRYFLRRQEGGLAVEMIDFFDLAFPTIRDWFVAHADPTARRAPAGRH